MSFYVCDDMLPFLDPKNHQDSRLAALSAIILTTACVEGRRQWYKKRPDVIEFVIKLLKDSDPVIAKRSFSFFINISSDKEGTELLLKDYSESLKVEAKNGNDILSQLLDDVIDPKSIAADDASSILANITRYPAQTDQVYDFIEANKEKYSIQNIISVFNKTKHNEANCSLDTLAFFFANLSQSSKFRSLLLNQKENLIKRFLPFISHESSVIRRGAVTLIKNSCFDQASHEWLLSADVDILPHLLLPLAGPEQFDDEDNEKLPVDLQYLPDDKSREPEPIIRKFLLEALLMLCATKTCRTIIRDCNAYIILRELHKWEEDSEVLLACENVVDILIRTEEEIGVDNLLEVEVPSDLKEKFDKLAVENLKK